MPIIGLNAEMNEIYRYKLFFFLYFQVDLVASASRTVLHHV